MGAMLGVDHEEYREINGSMAHIIIGTTIKTLISIIKYSGPLLSNHLIAEVGVNHRMTY